MLPPLVNKRFVYFIVKYTESNNEKFSLRNLFTRESSDATFVENKNDNIQPMNSVLTVHKDVPFGNSDHIKQISLADSRRRRRREINAHLS